MTSEWYQAKQAVRRAALLCQTIQHEFAAMPQAEKGDRSSVTLADYCSQALIAERLLAHYPDIPIVAEEQVGDLRRENGLLQRVCSYLPFDVEAALTACVHEKPQTDRYWVLDPLDGTAGFLRKAHYAICLALIEKGCPRLGIVACPHWEGGLLLTAECGKGVKRERLGTHDAPASLSLPPSTELSQARICSSVDARHSSEEVAQRIVKSLGIHAESYRIDSQAKYAAVALNQAQIYLRLPTSTTYREKTWDHAAGALIVQEVGGSVTDVFGHPLDFSQGTRLENNRGVIASVGIAHEQVVQAYKEVVKAHLGSDG